MANKSDKRIAAENASTLAMLKYGFLATHVHDDTAASSRSWPAFPASKTDWVACSQLLQLVCFLLFSSRRTRSHILLYLLTSVPSLALYAQLVSMGSPRAKSAGDDLGQAGLTQYMLDVVFVTWAAQTGALVTSKAWWLYALVGKVDDALR
jgi:hypothetical protein